MVVSPSQLTRTKMRPSSRMLALSDRLMKQVAQLQEFGHLPGDDLVARLRQIDLDRTLDAPGCAGDHRDAIAEIDRLLDIVGDEYKARARRIAQPVQFVLQL